MSFSEDSSCAFEYPFFQRIILRLVAPVLLTAGLFVFHFKPFLTLLLCSAALAFWLRCRRFGLKLRVGGQSIEFIRGKAIVANEWAELDNAAFSTAGVTIQAKGKQWLISSSLLQWKTFKRIVEEHAPSAALAGWLRPPFRVRAKWLALSQPLVLSCALLFAASINARQGNWAAALIFLSLGVFFFSLIRHAVLWYRFEPDALVIHELTGKKNLPWSQLTFAAIRDNLLVIVFGERTIAIARKQITQPLEDIFLSMREFWDKQLHPAPSEESDSRRPWSWPAALTCWSLTPLLSFALFPILIKRVHARLGHGDFLYDLRMMPAWPCTDLQRLTFLLYLNCLLVAILLVTVGGAFAAGRYCDRERGKLVAVFRRTIVFLIIGVFAVMTCQSLLLAALVWYVPLEFANVRPSNLEFLIALGLAFGLYQLVRHSLQVFKGSHPDAAAVAVSAQEEPEIWKAVLEIAQKVGSPPPDRILLGIEPNFYVTEARIRLNGAELRGYSLYLSLAMMRRLGEGEWRAIVGHELGHFRGEDTRFSGQFFPLYDAIAKSTVAIAHGPASWTLLPAIYLLHFLLFSFGRVESAIRRDREFLADQAGSQAASAQALASSLVKLELFAAGMQCAVNRLIYTADAAESLAAAVPCYLPAQMPPAIARARTPHPFDTHPPLEERLARLNVRLEEAWNAAEQPTAIRLCRQPNQRESSALQSLRDLAGASSVWARYTYVPQWRPAVQPQV